MERKQPQCHNQTITNFSQVPCAETFEKANNAENKTEARMARENTFGEFFPNLKLVATFHQAFSSFREKVR